MERQLHELLLIDPILSSNQRLGDYNLTGYAKKLQSEMPQAEWNAKQDAVLHPVFFSWMKGFYGTEGTGENSWRWCKKQGEVRLMNTSTQPKLIRFEMKLKSENNGKVFIKSNFFNEDLQLSQTPVLFVKSFIVPSGQHEISFYCDAPKVNAPNDPRELVFNITGFQWRLGEQ